MDSLPKEIVEHLLTFLDRRNKQSARLVSLLWFNSVKITKFKFYEVGSDNFPWLMDRLSQYNYPLSLSMTTIPYSISLKQFIDEISQLTQLKSIRCDQSSLNANVEEDYWLKLSTLTNIESWQITGDWPHELLSKFPRLKKINRPNLTAVPNSFFDLQLEKLTGEMRDYNDRLVVPLFPSSLKSLELRKLRDNIDLNHLTNLTRLTVSNDTYNEVNVKLDNVTSLLRLQVENVNVPYIHNNANLTRLDHYVDPYEFPSTVDIIEEISLLTRLERLLLQESLVCNASSNPLSALSRLTSLALNIAGDLSLLSDSVKHLSLIINSRFDRESLTHLTNLEELSIYEASSQADYSKEGNFISKLTKLKQLSFDVTWRLSTLKIETISSLTDLQRLTLRRAMLEPNDYIYLTNLRYLQIERADLTEEAWNNFAYLTNLTYLAIRELFSESVTDAPLKSINYTVISHLPLRKLIARPSVKEELNLIQCIAQMTNLLRLETSQMSQENGIQFLTDLQQQRQSASRTRTTQSNN